MARGRATTIEGRGKPLAVSSGGAGSSASAAGASGARGSGGTKGSNEPSPWEGSPGHALDQSALPSAHRPRAPERNERKGGGPGDGPPRTPPPSSIHGHKLPLTLMTIAVLACLVTTVAVARRRRPAPVIDFAVAPRTALAVAPSSEPLPAAEPEADRDSPAEPPLEEEPSIVPLARDEPIAPLVPSARPGRHRSSPRSRPASPARPAKPGRVPPFQLPGEKPND